MPTVSLVNPATPSMRYLRICFGGESGEAGMTLYEVDEDGWVHRQVQLHAEGSRFSPEDILMCQPVITEAMMSHPATDEIFEEDFELMWREVEYERPFFQRIPDVHVPWEGRIISAGRVFELAWAPQAAPTGPWRLVPGFSSLYVRADAERLRSVCAALFVGAPIEWYAASKVA